MDSYTYPIKLERKGGKYWVSCEAFPGVLGIGDTAEEAKTSILAAMKLYIEECLAEGRPVPTPGKRQKETVSVAVYDCLLDWELRSLSCNRDNCATTLERVTCSAALSLLWRL